MPCNKYMQLTEEEQNIYRAKLDHAVRNNDILFIAGARIIQRGEEAGVYEDVKFGREACLQTAEDEQR